MKYFAFSSSFAKIIIYTFSFVLAASATHINEGFLHCLTSHISNSTSTPNPIIYTPKNPSYLTILNSSIQNPRFSSPSTPKPFLIVTPFHVSDVQATVYCSKKHGMQIRTRSGGHDLEGRSYVSNTGSNYVVIDLRNLSSINVDVKSKTAWVQAGATLGELYYNIAKRSGVLGFPAGDCHTVGVGGQFGGGGYGFLTRKYGIAADNILDAQLIDAEGRIHDRKSMGEDVFWAIRGGGAASFGIILAWKLRLVDVPPKVTVFEVNRNFEQDETKKLFHRWQHRADKVDEDLSFYPRFVAANSTYGEGNKKIILVASFRATFNGGVDRLLKLMETEFPELGLQRHECIEMTWIESFLFHNFFRNGESLDVLLSRKSNLHLTSFKSKSDFVTEPIPDDVVERMLGSLYEEQVGRAWFELYPYGGKMSNISESKIAFPHRARNLYMILYYVEWDQEKENITESKRHVRWVRRLYNYMTPYVAKNPRATYLNFRDLDIGVNDYNNNNNIERARIWGNKYFKNNFKRLVRVKTKFDPTNFFTYEQSIPPLRSY